MTVFQYENYKDYLGFQVAENRDTRGYLTSMAHAAGCQLSVISHVLKKKIHLTPDQACGLSEFWNHSELESDYFLNLVHLGRAGSPRLSRRLKRELADLRRLSSDVTHRIGARPSITGGDEALYYSSWHWMALHIAASLVPASDTAGIATRLGLPVQVAQQALEKLASLGLVQLMKGSWRIGKADMHLSQSSPFSAANHLNWRQRAMHDIQGFAADSMHYTSVQSMTRRNFEILRDLALAFVRDSRELAVAGPEEELCCVTLDVFRP